MPCVFEMALSLLYGLQLLPQKGLPKVLGYTCQLCTGMLATLRHAKWHWISSWTTKPRPRSLLTIMGTWTFSSCVHRGTQLPTFKGLVFKLSSAQGYWCHWRREDVQLDVEMQDIFAKGTACPFLSRTERKALCGSRFQMKKKLKLTENTGDAPLPGCIVRFCYKIFGNRAF